MHLDRRQSIVVVFFLQALASGGIFTRIADVQVGLGLTEAQLGLVLAAQPLGGFLSFAFASWVVEKVGTRRVCVVGIAGVAVTAVLFGAGHAVWIVAASQFCYGIFFSLSNIAMNVEADRVEAATGTRVMNRCHGVWSLGVLLASLIGVAARGWAITPGVHLGLIAPVILLGIVVFVLPMAQSAVRGHAGRAARIAFPMPSRATLGIVCFGLVGGALQGGAQNWSVIYMRDSFVAAQWVEALAIPAFLLALSLGRLFGDGWVSQYGVARTATVLGAVSGVGLICVATAGWLWLAIFGFALMGLGTAVIFPLMVSAAAIIGDRAASENVAAVVMATGIAMLAVPPLMGFMADSWGLRVAYGMMLPLVALSLLSVRFVVPCDGSG